MGEIISIIPPDADDIAFELKDSPAYLESAKEVSDFIVTLPLSREQNDRLIHMLHGHVGTARKGAFMQGMILGASLANDRGAT